MNAEQLEEKFRRYDSAFASGFGPSYGSNLKPGQRFVLVVIAEHSTEPFSADNFFKQQIEPLFPVSGGTQVIKCLNEIRAIYEAHKDCPVRKAIQQANREIQTSLQKLEEKVCGAPQG